MLAAAAEPPAVMLSRTVPVYPAHITCGNHLLASTAASCAFCDCQQYGRVLQRPKAVRRVRDDEQIAVPALPDVTGGCEQDPAAQHVHAGLAGVGVLGQR